MWLFQGAGPGAPQPSPSSQLPGLRPAGVHSALCRAGRIGPLQSFSVAGLWGGWAGSRVQAKEHAALSERWGPGRELAERQSPP